MSSPSIRFESREYASFADINLDQCDLLFRGTTVDERGEAAIQNLVGKATKCVQVSMQETVVVVDGNSKSGYRVLTELIDKHSKVRIEATTLGLSEIIRIIQGARESGVRELEFIYLEPIQYSEPGTLFTETGLPQHRDFRLTTNRKFVGLNGFNHEHSGDQSAHHVFFLGFEPSRLEQALEQKGDPDPKNYGRTAVIGVPAFSPGWENNVFSSHASLLQARAFTPGDIRYCAANSPRDAYHFLWELWSETANVDHLFYVSPFGTKPHAVGAALFLVETKGCSSSTALYYDHPVRPVGRSKSVRRWHVWKVRFG